MSHRPRIVYVSGDSRVHRLYPLVKLGWLLWGSLAVFVVRSPWWALAMLASALWVAGLAGVNPRRDIRGLRWMLGMAGLLLVLQGLFVKQGTVLFRLVPFGPGYLAVTDTGLYTGLYVGARFLAVILLSCLFVLTTDPGLLAHASMRAGLPYRYGFALITALRLAPIFEVEGNTVYQAQLARGVRYDVRHPARIWTMVRQLLLPLLISALSKVDALAVSMEGRCFGKYATRTYREEVDFTRSDAYALVLLALAFAGLLVYTIK